MSAVSGSVSWDRRALAGVFAGSYGPGAGRGVDARGLDCHRCGHVGRRRGPRRRRQDGQGLDRRLRQPRALFDLWLLARRRRPGFLPPCHPRRRAERRAQRRHHLRCGRQGGVGYPNRHPRRPPDRRRGAAAGGGRRERLARYTDRAGGRGPDRGLAQWQGPGGSPGWQGADRCVAGRQRGAAAVGRRPAGTAGDGDRPGPPGSQAGFERSLAAARARAGRRAAGEPSRPAQAAAEILGPGHRGLRGAGPGQ